MEKNYRAELVGVFGDPVDGNPTGVLEEAGFAAKGLNYRYLTMKVTPDDFDTAMKSLKALHMKGINLTMPHKIAVLPYLDEVSEAAGIIGAVNTVVLRDGKLIGDNTDGKGFVQALKNENISPAGKNIAILGAGGASKAIAVECALADAASITIINRSEARGQELVQAILQNTNSSASYLSWSDAVSIPARTDILINATSIGLHPNIHDQPDINYDTITPDMVVSDVIFNPAITPFLTEAGKRGAKTISGLGMLVCQGALNFTIWTGVEAPYDIMYEALKKEFE
ncbi:MAG: shikimate dehydrogenase [Lachnospiraceae bacterium]|nr:shikimate dehydrogenase [Lachnospiraceae bacterium]MDD3794422.1 shikimate dehydrogenase [Lachnospiraceae bacterium]